MGFLFNFWFSHMLLTSSHILLRRHRYLSSNWGIVQSLFAFGGDFVPPLSVRRLNFLLAVMVKVGWVVSSLWWGTWDLERWCNRLTKDPSVFVMAVFCKCRFELNRLQQPLLARRRGHEKGVASRQCIIKTLSWGLDDPRI